MKRLLFVFMLAMVSWLVAQSENYPYRSDMLWVAIPDHANWLYETGENASVDILLLRYGVPVDGVEIYYELGDDMMPGDTKGRVKLKNGKARINIGTMTQPGFRDCRLTANIGSKIYRHHIKVGFSPEKIEPYTKMPDDFDVFWAQAKAELAKTPLKFTMTDASQYATDKMDCYLVNLKINTQGQSVYGYLFIPKDAEDGSCPIVVSPPGAGIKTIKEPLRHKYYGENGCIRFEMEIHGLNPEMTDEQFAEISKAFNGRENGYLENGMDDKDNYYMKRVYLSMVRVVDFLTTLPQWDNKNVIFQGGSQGGALAIVGASLDPRATACVANHPALSDMAGYMAGRAGGYPHFFGKTGSATSDRLKTIAYYDVVNFARRLTVPTYITWGYNDDVCPPTTSYAVFNVINAPKEALITPINELWTSDDTERSHLDWIKSHLK